MGIWRHAEANIEELPAWPILAIEKIADINPRIDKSTIPDDLPVSFVPMPAVGAGDGSIRVEETRPAEEVKKGFTPFLEGDVLFAKITPCMENGKMAVVPKLVNGYGFGSTEFHVLRPKPVIDAKYLYYYVSSQSFRGEAERYMTGAVGQKRVSTDYLKRSKIPVAPLGQQKNIVAEIEKQFSRLDEAVASLKRVKANLKRYKAAVLKDAVEGRLVETEAELAAQGRANVAGGTMPGATARQYESGEELLKRILETRRLLARGAQASSQWLASADSPARGAQAGKAGRKGRGKYKEPAATDTTDLPELPEGWAWATVQQLADVQLGKMLDRQKHRSGKALPYLRNINVRWDSVDSSDLLTMFFKESEFDRFGLHAGDVLVCEGGEPGRAAVWDGRDPGMMYQKAIHRVRFIGGYQQRMLVFYLEFLAKTGRLERWFTGSTIKHFTRESFAQIPIPVAPAAEQMRIVAEVDRRLSLVREVEVQIDINLQRSERLRRSMLARAFHREIGNACV